jgi:hypothetical protein
LGAIVTNEETGFGTIKCPGCGEAIPISEAIHHQIAERTRQEFKAEALEGKRVLAARERELNEKAAALDQTISERLAAERVSLTKELEAQLRAGFSTEIADLKRQADERSERLAQAQAIELELRTEKRNLEEREKARDLEMARKLDEERVRIQQEISSRLEEEHARQVAEKDKRLSDAMKANDELRRKLQQGSQQLQGEVLDRFGGFDFSGISLGSGSAGTEGHQRCGYNTAGPEPERRSCWLDHLGIKKDESLERWLDTKNQGRPAAS